MTSPAQLVKNPPASVRDTGDTRSIPGLGRSPGGGNGDLLQYSYLETLRTEDAGGATACGVTESDTTEREHTPVTACSLAKGADGENQEPL